MTAEEVAGLADILRRRHRRYDNLFEISFPYSMGFHQAPTDGQIVPGLAPARPLLPAPAALCHCAQDSWLAIEMLGMPQRDLTPETAAERLRER